ncbi:YihY/virulence factor BrkB family protein [Clostridium sp.]|uniref:YihY/virulence factor BrkB family protein n=1 Tax=Clostridium sp. TaxID=1506 RepID=UPI002637E0FE|nr:YihY/virulence factor BrkB family protein [Clostridium sp.]
MNNNFKKENTIVEKIIFFIVKISNDDIFALASQLAYYLILSFFPLIISIITLVGFSNLNSEEVLISLSTLVPDSVYVLIDKTIIEIVDTQNVGLLGASIAITVWSASSGFRAVIKGVNKAYNIKEHRSYIKRAVVAIFFTLALTIIIALTLSALVFGKVIGDYITTILPFEHIISVVWNITRYGIVLFMMILVFAGIYRYTPAKKIPWKEVVPGSIFSSLGWVIVSLAFSYYINSIANYSRLYGSLGAVFILMTWLYLTSIILILGAEINSVLAPKNKKF